MSESVKITDALRQRILDKVMTTPIPSDVNLFEFVALNAAREMAILIRERYRVQHMPTCPVGADKLECPTCGGLLGMVRQGANSMLNSYQFDAVKAGDYYCTACKGGEAQGSTYKYWWNSDLAKHPCSCGLDDLLASLVSGDAPVPQQEKDEKAFSAELAAVVNDTTVVPTPQLTHDDAIAALRHVIEVCAYHACDLDQFQRARLILKRLEAGDLFLITQKQYADDRFQSLMDGIEVGNLATERAIEAGVLARVSPPIWDGRQ